MSFDWIRAITFRDRKYPPPTTAADLDSAERELGARLPAGYRAFAERFGLGGRLHSLPELFPLTPIPGPLESYWFSSVLAAARFYRAADTNLRKRRRVRLPEDFIVRAVIFGVEEGEHTFAFDTGEITSTAPLEYRIFDLPRDFADPKPIADSFENWLKWIDDRYRLGDDGSQEERDKERLGLQFDPDSSGGSPMPYWRSCILPADV